MEHRREVGVSVSSSLCYSLPPFPAEKVTYTCVTAGCPTAYSHKFKQGGLAKLRHTSPLAHIG